jgi:hypothetical protein
MSKKKTITLITAVLLLMAAGVVVWAIQNSAKPPANDIEQTTANSAPSLPNGTVETALPDESITAEQTNTAKQKPDEFLRNATNFDGTGLISLNMTKDELTSLLKDKEISFSNDAKNEIVVSEKEFEVSYKFSNNKLFYILAFGSANGGIQNLNIGGTVADMKKILGDKYILDTEANNGPASFAYKTKSDTLFIVRTIGEKSNNKITGFELLLPKYFGDIYNGYL